MSFNNGRMQEIQTRLSIAKFDEVAPGILVRGRDADSSELSAIMIMASDSSSQQGRFGSYVGRARQSFRADFCSIEVSGFILCYVPRGNSGGMKEGSGSSCPLAGSLNMWKLGW